jgi:hypothetical protein
VEFGAAAAPWLQQQAALYLLERREQAERQTDRLTDTPVGVARRVSARKTDGQTDTPVGATPCVSARAAAGTERWQQTDQFGTHDCWTETDGSLTWIQGDPRNGHPEARFGGLQYSRSLLSNASPSPGWKECRLMRSCQLLVNPYGGLCASHRWLMPRVPSAHGFPLFVCLVEQKATWCIHAPYAQP